MYADPRVAPPLERRHEVEEPVPIEVRGLEEFRAGDRDGGDRLDLERAVALEAEGDEPLVVRDDAEVQPSIPVEVPRRKEPRHSIIDRTEGRPHGTVERPVAAAAD